MAPAFADQEKLVPQILSRFGEFPDDLFPSPNAVQNLRSTIDSAVHFYYFLSERAPEPIDINSPEIHNVLCDLTAYASFFWQVRGSMRLVLFDPDNTVHCQWKVVTNLMSFKEAYFGSYEMLISETTVVKERYFHLLQLTKLQLIFLGLVFA